LWVRLHHKFSIQIAVLIGIILMVRYLQEIQSHLVTSHYFDVLHHISLFIYWCFSNNNILFLESFFLAGFYIIILMVF